MDDKNLAPIVDDNETFDIKPSLFDKFLKRVSGMERASFENYLLNDIVIPAAKDLVLDVVEGMLHGHDTPRMGNRYYRSVGRGGTTYTAFFGNGLTKKIGAPARLSPGYDDSGNVDIIDNSNYAAVAFRSRGKAEEVLLNMRDRVEALGHASIGDFNDLARRKGEAVDYNYGWYNLDDARVSRVGGGAYVIRFPKPTSIR